MKTKEIRWSPWWREPEWPSKCQFRTDTWHRW